MKATTIIANSYQFHPILQGVEIYPCETYLHPGQLVVDIPYVQPVKTATKPVLIQGADSVH